MPNLSLVVIQPTPFCNISCKYCYLADRSNASRMTLETVEKTFFQVFASGWVDERLDISWHAGEPLAVPVEFYREAIQRINGLVPQGVDVRHIFQTNGTLIDDFWCRFFQASNSRVGISIDGPQSLNDLNRVRRSGASTFSDTLRGIRKLNEHRIGFYVITVLGRSSLRSAEALYRFYADEGIDDVAFNIEEIEGANVSSSLNVDSIETEFDGFLREFWNLNVKHRRIRRIREFDHMLAAITGRSRVGVKNTLIVPFAVLNVDWQGNFSTFSPELLGSGHKAAADFVLGNVWHDELVMTVKSPKLRRLIDQIAAGVDACRGQCEYFTVCGGGEPANKLFENGSFATSETLACRLTVKVVANVMADIAEKAFVTAAP
jgi:uncharacterized protein